MKIQYLFSYAQARARILSVLNELQLSYGPAHGIYDQTHAIYDRTHGLRYAWITYKLTLNQLLAGMNTIESEPLYGMVYGLVDPEPIPATPCNNQGYALVMGWLACACQ